MKTSSPPERTWRRLALAVVGLLVLSFPYAWAGLGFPPFPPPLTSIFNGIGITLFLAGTVSLGIEELIRGSTIEEFKDQTGMLLGETGRKLSTELTDFLKCYIVELRQQIEELRTGIQRSNIKMIYPIREDGLKAMGSAIREADNFVYIMGISLREFFQLDTPCYHAIRALYHAHGDLKFKVLILSNQSPEALERSSREASIPYKDFDDPEYKISKLFTETRATIQKIQSEKGYPRMALRVYDNQSLFLLITDKVVFMEPYHYGERREETEGFTRVAELVPLIEFVKTIDPKTRGPYEQFLGHFEYVFERAKEPTAEHVRV